MAQDAIDKLLALTPEQQRSALGRLSPQQLQVVRTKIQERQQSKPSDTLLASRKAASASELEANLPESTIASRLRESRIGLLEPFTAGSMLETGKAGVEALYDALSGKGTGKGVELLKGMVTAPVRPVVNLYEGIKTGDYDKTVYGAGGFLSQTVPAVAGIAEATPRTIGELREAATAWKLPERLQTRAAANRVKLGNQPWQERALIMGPSAAIGGGVGSLLGGPVGGAVGAVVAPSAAEALALIRRSKWYRGMKASTQEAAARALASKKGSVASIGINEADMPRANIGTEIRQTPQVAAVEEESRIRQATANQEFQPEAEAPYVAPKPIPPTTPGFLKDQLAQMRQDLEVDPAEFRTKTPATR